jgi:methylase of polypeptide subunit release factors
MFAVYGETVHEDHRGAVMSGKAKSKDKAHRSTQLRVFFSVDLVGGTAYKSRGPADDFSSAESWPNRFEGFFQEFTRSFKERVIEARAEKRAAVMPPPELWKINGDELLFTELVYADPDQQHTALKSSLRTFVDLVHETDEHYVSEGLGVRACVWTAGFPLRNKRLQIVQGGIELLADDAGRSDPDTGPGGSVPVTVNDYIGRDMDLGFRLAAKAPPGRVICSLDLAEFALALPAPKGLSVWHVGWSALKGILDSQPYPLLWLEGEQPAKVRHPWDESTNEYSSPEMREFLQKKEALTGDEFASLAERVRALSAGQLIVPYASLTGMPQDHEKEYGTQTTPDPVRELHAGEEVDTTASDFAVSSGHAETITLDDLNQLLLWLQDNPEKAGGLKEILSQIAAHPNYREWGREQQFEGDLFRLHHSLAFASDEKRWLLESKLLVKNDALRVKLNLCGDQVFMTDGLWIDPSIRAFPFSDESDLVVRACEESGWMGWATCVVDPATGCGHNLLRYRGGDVRRYGFDRNTRALAYAGINAALNGVPAASFANGDIRNGIPPVFSQDVDERVLVVANMPFALVPNREQIARSAQGGRHGYELTVALIDAIDALSGQLSQKSQLRCVILAYSVGHKATDSWAVPNYASEQFGKAGTKWSLWPEERLWRVNGKKEQVNPMPLDLLKLKADCRFYVRGDVNPEVLREEYEKLTGDLEKEKLDHLAYGVITADVPLRRRLRRRSLRSDGEGSAANRGDERPGSARR